MIYLKNKISGLLLIALLSINAASLKAQDAISGIVTDAASGLPVNAAQIVCSEFAGTFTEENGSFTLRIPYSDAVVTVKANGYLTQNVAVKGKTHLEVKLLSESADFANKSYALAGLSLEDRIQQEFGYLRTIIRSGAPGAGGNLFIRGFNSVSASSQPLILVDGIPYDMLLMNRPAIIGGSFIDPLTNIDPEDIENIKVIRDGSAYGVKSANGVIAITTKRAKEQTSHITFSSSLGVNSAPRQFPLLQANDYRTFITEQAVSAGNPVLNVLDYVYLNDNPNQQDYETYHNNTNWQNEIFHNGWIQNYHVSVTGGDEIAKYSLMLGYTDTESTLKNAFINRFNARFNTDIDLSKNVQLSLGVSYSQTDRELRDDGMVFRSSPSYLALIKSPLVSPTLIKNGIRLKTLSDKDFWNVGNPVLLQSTDNNTMGENDQYRLGLYGKVNWSLGGNWLLNATMSYDYDKTNERFSIPDVGTAEVELERLYEISKRVAGDMAARYVGLYSDVSARYKKTLASVHRVNAAAGFRYQNNRFDVTGGTGHNSSQDSYVFLETRMIGKEIYGNQDVWKWVSAYVDGEYSLKDRYYLSVHASEDGSSRAGANRQYGFFPSAEITWDIAAEPFLAKASWLNTLQLRTAAGLAGNDNFSYLSAAAYFQSVDFMNMKGLALANLANPDLTWETTTKTNLGLDWGIFNNRLSLSADVFLNKTKDLLLPQALDQTSGFTTAYINGGELENKGIELRLGLRLIDTRYFKWITQLSATKYKNRITALPGANRILNSYLDATALTTVGQPVGVFYGYKSLGVFTTADAAHQADLYTYYKDTYRLPFEAGDIHFEDVDGNHLIDESDRQIIGDPNPDFYGSLAMSFIYKNVSLEMVFTGVYGNDVYNYRRAQMENMVGYRNQSTSVLDRWKAEGQYTTVPRSDYYDSRGNGRFSDRWIEDGSYLRMKNLTLTWKHPKKLLFLDGFSIFASMNNIFVLTNYLGTDPEFSPSGLSVFQGIDAGYLSQGRSFVGGIKFNL
jgi:TonB-linked SusC/RagA family outer membrane protein